MSLGTEVGLGQGDIVLDEDPPLLPRKGHSRPPLFGQTAGWIKMPFGTEVGIGPGDIVLDGDPAPPSPKRSTTPNFWPMHVVAKGWMDAKMPL